MQTSTINKIINSYIKNNIHCQYIRMESVYNNFFKLAACYFMVIILLFMGKVYNKDIFIRVITISTSIFLLLTLFLLWKLMNCQINNNKYNSNHYIKNILINYNANVESLHDALVHKAFTIKCNGNTFLNIFIPVTTFFCSIFLSKDIFSFSGDTLIMLIAIVTVFLYGLKILKNIIDVLIECPLNSPTLLSYNSLLEELNDYKLTIDTNSFYFLKNKKKKVKSKKHL